MNRILAVTLWVLLAACGGEGAAKPPPEAAGEKWVFVNPLLDTKPGEWVRYRLGEEENANTMQVQVLEQPGKRGVFVQVEIRGGDVGRIIERTVRPLSKNHILTGYQSAGWTVARMYPDEIFVAGRRFRCLCVEYVTRMSGNVRAWYTQEIPAWGMLRQVRIEPGGQQSVNAEIVDWSGRSEN